jgi:hypothetical protein
MLISSCFLFIGYPVLISTSLQFLISRVVFLTWRFICLICNFFYQREEHEQENIIEAILL